MKCENINKYAHTWIGKKNKVKYFVNSKIKFRFFTNLIPWPGPQLMPVILMLEQPPFIAIQSSPIYNNNNNNNNNIL